MGKRAKLSSLYPTRANPGGAPVVHDAYTAFPLPGTTFDGATVVASIWMRDEDLPAVALAMLLLLEPSVPYYRVQDIQWQGGAWAVTGEPRRFPNIVPAVEHYVNEGGDY